MLLVSCIHFMHTFYPKGLLENTQRGNPTQNGLSQRKWNVFFFCLQPQLKYGLQDYIAWNSSDCFESFSPLNNDVTEGVIMTRSNRMKFRLKIIVPQKTNSTQSTSTVMDKFFMHNWNHWPSAMDWTAVQWRCKLIIINN